MRVVITGGTGFLGRGILRAWAGNKDYDLVVLSRDEYKQDLCRQKYPYVHYVLGDVTDYGRCFRAFDGADLVIHTAAIKYIPEAEFNVDECININVDGSRTVLEAAYEARVKSVIGISTDKACLPVNVYGMTKALMERVFGEYAATTSMHCALARYGNVIGSTGSVIPLFKRQLKEQGYITITNPNMTRYWITINEAVHLIELAMFAQSGSIIIPKPRAMTMEELAQTLVDDCVKHKLSDEPVRYIGMRPGEKFHEALLHSHESIRAIDQNTHYELLPVGSVQVNDPFILSSNTPQGGWVTPEQLLSAIEDAERV